MIANYHTHTIRCCHATGTEREYIEKAIKSGLKILGFSDHAPYPFPEEWNHVSPHRMKPEQLADYVETLRKLREEYKDRIKIFIGLEAEYYPDVFKDFLSLIEPFELDYLILGQHYNGNEVGYGSNFDPSDDEARLSQYVDQVIEGINTGKFSYIAHPDVINFTGSDKIYERYMSRLCEEAKRFDLPLEVNCQGLYLGRHYPSRRFWKIASKTGNKAIIGCDAHQLSAVADHDQWEAAVEYLAEFGMKPVEVLKLIKV